MNRLLPLVFSSLCALPFCAHAQQSGAWRNGGPSPAQQMQNANSAAYLERARAVNQPSPAARLQQQQPPQQQSQPGLLPGFTPYHQIPEAQRQAIVQQHYPAFPDHGRRHQWHEGQQKATP